MISVFKTPYSAKHAKWLVDSGFFRHPAMVIDCREISQWSDLIGTYVENQEKAVHGSHHSDSGRRFSPNKLGKFINGEGDYLVVVLLYAQSMSTLLQTTLARNLMSVAGGENTGKNADIYLVGAPEGFIFARLNTKGL